MSLVAINVGSSSVRTTVFDGAARRDQRLPPAETGSLAAIEAAPAVVMHRIVHGGPRLRATAFLDDACLAELRAITDWAPLHLPRALAWVEAARHRWPDARQVAVFDTTLYAGLPAAASTYALPAELRVSLGIRRYGFHGLAHQSMSRSLGTRARTITIQLGSGASMTALRDGRAIDTTMGFSPLEGLVMATRAGDVDPGALLYLLHHGIGLETLDRMLEHESGLKGLAGDSDMRALLARDDAEAHLGIDVYVHRARRYLGAMLAALGGCDAIAFGGGVGENASSIRAAILDGFDWAGLAVDELRNGANDTGLRCISSAQSRIEVWVAPVDEAAVMRDEAELLLHKLTTPEDRP